MRKKQPKRFKSVRQPRDLIQKAILDTLRYRSIFDAPMTIFMLWGYLICEKKITPEDFTSKIAALSKSKRILVKNGFYSTGRIDLEELEKKRRHSHRLIKKALGITNYLKHIPWIEMIAITGSVAAFNANEQSDIDLLIVSKPKRLWLSRLFLVLILKIMGVYLSVKKPAGTICPNIFITRDNLAWDREKRNVYTANEVSLVYPVFYRHNCYFDFLRQNNWATAYLPNLHIPNIKTPVIKQRTLCKVIDVLESVAMRLQIIYMKNKKTSEVVSKNFIHFNVHDTSKEILNKYSLLIK